MAMEVRKSVLSSLAAVELLGAACGVAPQPSPDNLKINKDHELVKTSEYGIHRWALLSPTFSFKAIEDNTTFEWEGQYCRGNYTPNPQEISATCEGYLLTIRGKERVNKGEAIDCARMELPLMSCILSSINPPLTPVYTIYPRDETTPTPSNP